MDVRGTFWWRRDRLSVGTGGDVLGRAWVIEADGTRRQITEGNLITRSEAERLATAGEYTFDAEP